MVLGTFYNIQRGRQILTLVLIRQLQRGKKKYKTDVKEMGHHGGWSKKKRTNLPN